jgi:hypothetical protein
MRHGRAVALIRELRFQVLSRERRLELLHELAATKQPRAAPFLLADYVEHDLSAAGIALLLEPLVARFTGEALLSWGYRIGEDPYLNGYDRKLHWEKLAAFREVRGGWAAFAVASLARDGYIRQPAVRALDELLHDGREVPFLLLRSTDHVPAVRRTAMSAIQSRFTIANAGPFVSALPLILGLGVRQRGDPAILGWLLQMLSSPSGAPALNAGLHSPDAEVRRACFDLALRLLPDQAAELGLRDSDPAIRPRTVRALEAGSARRAVEDRHPSVRAAAFSKLAASTDPTDRDLWTRALLDPSSTVRMMARLWLSKHAQVDVPSIYRSAVAAREHLPAAIAGMAESCPPQDAAELLFIGNANARVREELVAALAKMLRWEAADALVPFLLDSNARVALKATRALRRYGAPGTPEAVWKLLPAAPASRSPSLLGLLASSPSRWVSLDHLLRAAALPEPVRSQAASLLTRWRPAPRPLSRTDAIGLRGKLRSLPAGLLPDRVAASIDSALDYWIGLDK